MKIISLIKHEGYLFALVFNGTGAIPMYRSSGSNSGAKGIWFPFAGILIKEGEIGYESQIRPWDKITNNNSGWIVKFGTVIKKDSDGATKAYVTEMKRGDHKNIFDRLTPIKNIKGLNLIEISKFLSDTLEFVYLSTITRVNAEGVNMWIRLTSKEFLSSME